MNDDMNTVPSDSKDTLDSTINSRIIDVGYYFDWLGDVLKNTGDRNMEFYSNFIVGGPFYHKRKCDLVRRVYDNYEVWGDNADSGADTSRLIYTTPNPPSVNFSDLNSDHVSPNVVFDNRFRNTTNDPQQQLTPTLSEKKTDTMRTSTTTSLKVGTTITKQWSSSISIKDVGGIGNSITFEFSTEFTYTDTTEKTTTIEKTITIPSLAVNVPPKTERRVIISLSQLTIPDRPVTFPIDIGGIISGKCDVRLRDFDFDRAQSEDINIINSEVEIDRSEPWMFGTFNDYLYNLMEKIQKSCPNSFVNVDNTYRLNPAQRTLQVTGAGILGGKVYSYLYKVETIDYSITTGEVIGESTQYIPIPEDKDKKKIVRL
ncbi:hypothetical protein EJ131_25230 [Bacillus mycoides]|uniref:ETX/MTX2 family pore-forming toxin n=1 Tax=Bacillus mycoides TaxID=1405 RepID=UPI0022B2E7E9|nr:ETX/MTX2 family pore-forming toxin [Bacillus mycoides]MCZ6943754.1 hypothetical protein [Bacillus mycoides]